MYSKRENMEDDKEEHGYLETDPTGRYGRFGEVLGKGAMKTVYKAIDEVLGIEVAWNQVKINEALRTPDDLQRLYSEVHLLSTLKHQSIIRFYTSWIDVENKAFNFVTEMFTSGSLREYRKKYKRVSIRAIKNWSRQILEGLVYLHGHDPPVIHRDLKCDNIFVNGHLGQVKIGDLGLAAILRGSQSAHSVIGTPEFMAPELYEEEYNELVDVYSFGMCLLEMLTSDYPYCECTNPAQIYKKVTSGKLPMAFFRIEDGEAQRFIGRCLLPAAKRPSAKDLLLDPFFLSDDSSSSLTKFGIQNYSLLNSEMEKLQLSDPLPRTEMKITGKLNPDDTIFLKVQLSDKDGSVRNVYFPFDIVNDTPMDVATEMVKELEIGDWEPFEIANMIDGEVSALLPRRRASNHDEYDDDGGSHHCFRSFSSCSSSQDSMASLVPLSEAMPNEYYWLHDDLFDDTSSQGTYSNLNYHSADELDYVYNNLASSTKNDKIPIMKSTHKCTRFSPQDSFPTSSQLAPYSSSVKGKRVMENGGSSSRLTRNRSLIDIRSQMLHRSLVEEVHKRRLFKTVGAVENIGFQAPCEVENDKNHSRSAKGENVAR
ncbi:probable serine/threonine-protein kinase WNK4 [Arachis duranensis]|uniref:non-specific serine/threonine protein kinase n=1 Tax=Arachis duranensis TaxID=130453 RepID=A0A6P4AW80_ARADU|nr:probable serine/threonine-protein kinase WNK4 [Arachis duranensis]